MRKRSTPTFGGSIRRLETVKDVEVVPFFEHAKLPVHGSVILGDYPCHRIGIIGRSESGKSVLWLNILWHILDPKITKVHVFSSTADKDAQVHSFLNEFYGEEKKNKKEEAEEEGDEKKEERDPEEVVHLCKMLPSPGVDPVLQDVPLHFSDMEKLWCGPPKEVRRGDLKPLPRPRDNFEIYESLVNQETGISYLDCLKSLYGEEPVIVKDEQNQPIEVLKAVVVLDDLPDELKSVRAIDRYMKTARHMRVCTIVSFHDTIDLQKTVRQELTMICLLKGLSPQRFLTLMEQIGWSNPDLDPHALLEVYENLIQRQPEGGHNFLCLDLRKGKAFLNFNEQIQ